MIFSPEYRFFIFGRNDRLASKPLAAIFARLFIGGDISASPSNRARNSLMFCQTESGGSMAIDGLHSKIIGIHEAIVERSEFRQNRVAAIPKCDFPTVQMPPLVFGPGICNIHESMNLARRAKQPDQTAPDMQCHFHGAIGKIRLPFGRHRRQRMQNAGIGSAVKHQKRIFAMRADKVIALIPEFADDFHENPFRFAVSDGRIFANAMLEKLKHWLRRHPAPAAPQAPDRRPIFHQALARYPAHVPPHRGLGRQISPRQAQQNLDWFLQTLPQRLAALRALTAETGLTLPEAPPRAWNEAENLVARLIDWTHACWPAAPYRPEHRQDEYWAASNRAGDDAIFSVTLDVATLLGETARAAASTVAWHWGLDMSRDSLRHALPSARRVVLRPPPDLPHPPAALLDMEAATRARYLDPQASWFQCPLPHDLWREYVRSACA